jgi:hypothetical protein
MTVQKLRVLSQKYPDKWVAMKGKSGDVVGVGKTPKEAFDKSQKRGVKDPLITKIPRDYASYILAQI